MREHHTYIRIKTKSCHLCFQTTSSSQKLKIHQNQNTFFFNAVILFFISSLILKVTEWKNHWPNRKSFWQENQSLNPKRRRTRRRGAGNTIAKDPLNMPQHLQLSNKGDKRWAQLPIKFVKVGQPFKDASISGQGLDDESGRLLSDSDCVFLPKPPANTEGLQTSETADKTPYRKV